MFALLALLANDFSFPAVLVLAIVDGSLASSSRALTRASAGAVLAPAKALREGNALLNVAFTVGSAGGPALGGIIVASAGVGTALAADAVSFLLVALVLLAARRLPKPEEDPEATGWRERLRLGLAYVGSRPALRRLLGAQALAFIFFSLVIPIEVVFAKETLDAGDSGYGALLSSWGVGMVIGSLIFAWLRQVSLPLLLFTSTLAIGVAYLGTSVAPNLVVACAASVVGGIGNGVQWIALVTAVQELTRATYQARVLSLLEATASAMPGIGFLLGGSIAAIFEPRASYAVAGAGVVIVLFLATRALRRVEWMPELEQTDRREDDASSVAGERVSRMVLTDS
jgi:MFS family permease